MTKSEFIFKLNSKNPIVKSCNTNNGWGFGGKVYVQYELHGFTVNIGRNCYRHAPSESFISVWNMDKRILDQRPSSRVFDKAAILLGL